LRRKKSWYRGSCSYNNLSNHRTQKNILENELAALPSHEELKEDEKQIIAAIDKLEEERRH